MIRFPIKSALVAAALAASIAPAGAAMIISEVAPWSSGNSPIGVDWFELTNTGSTAVNITGWKMDDNSNSFADAVSMSGVTSIAAGQSAIFAETSTVASTTAAFESLWFGSKVPAGFAMGGYSGSGVGLSSSGDAVNVYNASGVLQSNVTFGASPSGPVFATFDNAAGLNNANLTQLSVVGVNGAFAAAGDPSEIGSPGTIAPVPLPATAWLFIGGLGLLGAKSRRRT